MMSSSYHRPPVLSSVSYLRRPDIGVLRCRRSWPSPKIPVLSISRSSSTITTSSTGEDSSSVLRFKRDVSGSCILFRCRSDFLRNSVGIVAREVAGGGGLGASENGISETGDNDFTEIVKKPRKTKISGVSLLSKLFILLGIAATLTVISNLVNTPNPGASSKFPVIVQSLSHHAPPTNAVGFTFTLFGYSIILPEYTPGWVYFWLLMAAGCGLFISEEALNVWVGISLARKLTLDGTWNSFAQSFSNNAPYIISTVLWVYWGICISDMMPFYLGKLFRSTKTSEDICSKLGVGKDKIVGITRLLQKYGNLIGFIERFSIGVRNPTAFMAGAWGISADCFFMGVCCGALFTLPFQLAIGILLREHPVVALTSVAAAVGVWTVLPYIVAGSTALFLFLRRNQSV